MTAAQTIDLAEFAKGALPRTTDLQAVILAKDAAPYDFAAAKALVEDQARSNEDQRLNLPKLLGRLRARSAKNPLDAARRERDARQAQESAARERAEATLAKARAFCVAHADELEGWRARFVQGGHWQAFATRPVLESTPLMCAIFEAFGPSRGEARTLTRAHVPQKGDRS